MASCRRRGSISRRDSNEVRAAVLTIGGQIVPPQPRHILADTRGRFEPLPFGPCSTPKAAPPARLPLPGQSAK